LPPLLSLAARFGQAPTLAAVKTASRTDKKAKN
jgi:hypothetical protein